MELEILLIDHCRQMGSVIGSSVPVLDEAIAGYEPMFRGSYDASSVMWPTGLYCREVDQKVVPTATSRSHDYEEMTDRPRGDQKRILYSGGVGRGNTNHAPRLSDSKGFANLSLGGYLGHKLTNIVFGQCVEQPLIGNWP